MPDSSAPTSAAVLSPRELGRATLQRQLLLRRSGMSAHDAVRQLAGLQAQAPFSPYFQLWSRLDGFVPDDLAALLLERRVARIVAMRGTVHLLTAADTLAFRALTQVIMDRDLRTNTLHAAPLDGIDHAALATAARNALSHGPLSISELGAALATSWPQVSSGHLAYAARGLLPLVQVPPRAIWGRSGQVRLTPAESWLDATADPRQLSLEDLVLRYLAAFGPASVADIQTWSGLTRLRGVVDGMRERLRTFRTVDGAELFDLADAPLPDADTPAPPRFLPDYDNLIRSHADRTRVISDADRRRLNTRNGVVPHALLVDGTVAGTWRLTTEREVATLTATTFRALPATDRDDVENEGRSLLAFAAADASEHRFVTTHEE